MRRFLPMVSVVVALMLVGGCTNTLAPKVTCEGIRALTLGMSPNQVKTILGEPFSVTPSDLQPGVDMSLNYVANDGILSGLRFRVDFNRGGVVVVILAKRYLWDSRAVTVYYLGSTGKTDTPQLDSYVPCGSSSKR